MQRSRDMELNPLSKGSNVYTEEAEQKYDLAGTISDESDMRRLGKKQEFQVRRGKKEIYDAETEAQQCRGTFNSCPSLPSASSPSLDGVSFQGDLLHFAVNE